MTDTITPEQVQRQAFERHWLSIRRAKKAERELKRHPLQPQCYVEDSANRHWVTWQAALAQKAEQVPTDWVEIVTANLVREGVNKHKARNLAVHFHSLAAAPKGGV